MKFAYEYFLFPKAGLPKTLSEYEANYRPVAKELIRAAMQASEKIKDDF